MAPSIPVNENDARNLRNQTFKQQTATKQSWIDGESTRSQQLEVVVPSLQPGERDSQIPRDSDFPAIFHCLRAPRVLLVYSFFPALKFFFFTSVETRTKENRFSLVFVKRKGKVALRDYRIYSINRPRRLFNFGPLKVGAFSRWALIIFPTFSTSEDIFRE